jgi:hypothetical protein
MSIDNSKVVGVLLKTSESPENHIDGDWDYLDGSGRVEAQRVRRFYRWVSGTLTPTGRLNRTSKW